MNSVNFNVNVDFIWWTPNVMWQNFRAKSSSMGVHEKSPVAKYVLKSIGAVSNISEHSQPSAISSLDEMKQQSQANSGSRYPSKGSLGRAKTLTKDLESKTKTFGKGLKTKSKTFTNRTRVISRTKTLGLRWSRSQDCINDKSKVTFNFQSTAYCCTDVHLV